MNLIEGDAHLINPIKFRLGCKSQTLEFSPGVIILGCGQRRFRKLSFSIGGEVEPFWQIGTRLSFESGYR